MPIMPDCSSILFSLTNLVSFPFLFSSTHSSVQTYDHIEGKCVNVSIETIDSQLSIGTSNFGNTYICSFPNLEGYGIGLDGEGMNALTGGMTGFEGTLHLKMLEIYEVECINPPMQPHIPSEEKV